VNTAVPILLALLASLSPLLTLTWLWQIKEWRIDRLREHLRSEGCFRQLLGPVRPATVLTLFVLGILLPHVRQSWHLLALAALGILGLAQFATKRQRVPVWTQKAKVLFMCALTLTLLIAYVWQYSHPTLLVVLPLIQSWILGLSWVIFLPVDSLLKNRRMQRASALRDTFQDLTVIGITGSAGKTTLKELLACVLSSRDVLTTPAYVNSEMGVANWMLSQLSLRKESPPELLIVEMGAYRKGEIARLCAIAKPTLGAITFIGKQHMALFGSQETLSAAKAELLESLPVEGKAFLNADNNASVAVAKKAACPVVLVGTGGHADVEAFDIEETASGIVFREGDTRFAVPLHGTHNVTNVLLAIAIARELGMNNKEIASALTHYVPPSHTFSVRTEKGIQILDDTHNASPASFKAAMSWARMQPATLKVLLTSGLIELGQEQDLIHTELGEVATKTFDRVIFMNARSGRFFEKGFGKPIEIYSPTLPPLTDKSLLVCIGRVPSGAIHHLLS